MSFQTVTNGGEEVDKENNSVQWCANIVRNIICQRYMKSFLMLYLLYVTRGARLFHAARRDSLSYYSSY